MRIGIGLPNTIPGAPGTLIPAWARRAEERGFATLAAVDRIVYSNVEALVTLAAAAAVTSRVELLTDILLAPTRLPALLAKETASVDVLSGGRLTLGLAPGGREDDFMATGLAFSDRGRRFDATLALLQRTWRGEPLPGTSRPTGPAPPRGDIPILIGGTSPQAIARVARLGAGWTAGSGAAGALEDLVAQVEAAWEAAGRSGAPRISTLTYFALGEEAGDVAATYLRDYYGPDRGAGVLARTCRDPGELRDFVDRVGQAGVGEVVLFPAVADLTQVDLLADALL
jgi:alkanesulfonate monooxygenase SsuD/methylene tetrahydromethanopterin reductase-like flavin-dependent oxidoreductase (luciferase family)